MPTEVQSVLDEFTEKWERGESPNAESFLDRLGPVAPKLAVELIYREYCLAEIAGLDPDPVGFLARFPQHQEALERLFALHGACTPSLLSRWINPSTDPESLPGVGDEIGPYLLKRELGRGSFARVFLAEQEDLENRLVVVKLSTRPTREPWLLARTRHANIVEIVSHAMVDDGAFQMICMPFRGGATLGAVLAHRQQRNRRCVSGRDLLDDLDAVAAPEYPGVHPTRPAREILARLSYPQALAWVSARLAEALDHAFARDVAHGDVKPSNILLTADGNPMILDFNLAQDWSLRDASRRPVQDPGGTLAYMAPERLRAVAEAQPGDLDSGGIPPRSLSGTLPRPEPHSSFGSTAELERPPVDPHSADVYALGMVLLEALTGHSPNVELAPPPPSSPSRGLRRIASAYQESREKGGAALIRNAEESGNGSIPSAVRSILEHCLDTDPARRYRRALELAEDLDRWRADRPLAYAPEPFWGQTVPRCLRRNWRLLTAAAMAMAVCVCLIAMSSVMIKSARTYKGMGLAKIALNWDSPYSGTFQFQRPESLHLQAPDSPEVIATALRALKDFDVLGSKDWRERDEVRSLPAADREDLELWLMEQAYRYCRGLHDRPASPDDWQRALAALDRLIETSPLHAFRTLQAQLQTKLGQETEARPARSVPLNLATKPWLDEYLLGLACELDAELEHASAIRPASADIHRQASPEIDQPSLEGSLKALEHYERVLNDRPAALWGHYRAAVVTFRLRRWSEAAGHLQRCLARRPANPILRGQLATCLLKLNRSAEALEECNQALLAAPDHAEFFRSRAFIRASLRQTQGLKDDLARFELLRRFLPITFLRIPPARAVEDPRQAEPPTSHSALAIDAPRHFTPRDGAPLGESAAIDPEELDFRVVLAAAIRQAGESELAMSELEKILALDPSHLLARLTRLLQSIEEGRLTTISSDLGPVLDHPKLMAFLGAAPSRLLILQNAAKKLARLGMIEDALRVADVTLSCSVVLEKYRGQSRYTLALIHAIAGRADPSHIPLAANYLRHAFGNNRQYREWFARDRTFEPVRARITAELNRLDRLMPIGELY